MEMVWIVIGMVAAFFAGAHIRQPFNLRAREERTQETPEEDGVKDRQAEQLNNLMNYNGRRQYSEDE